MWNVYNNSCFCSGGKYNFGFQSPSHMCTSISLCNDFKSWRQNVTWTCVHNISDWPWHETWWQVWYLLVFNFEHTFCSKPKGVFYESKRSKMILNIWNWQNLRKELVVLNEKVLGNVWKNANVEHALVPWISNPWRLDLRLYLGCQWWWTSRQCLATSPVTDRWP